MSAFDSLSSAIQQNKTDCLLEPFVFSAIRQNEMLFFIKPEVFLLEPKGIAESCRLISDCFKAFEVETSGAYLMSAETLKAHGIMDRHYGYINKVSREASSFLSTEDKNAARQACQADAALEVIGGHEVMARFPQLDAKKLDDLWAANKAYKVRSGFYVQVFEYENSKTVVANGFHPYQLEHFIGQGRKIALIKLYSDLPWRTLRSRMLGDTFPEKAAKGSIRGVLRENAASLGFGEVTIANNCAHMSAGPFEAAFELHNFLSTVDDVKFDLSETRQAKHFAANGMSTDDLAKAIANPSAQMGKGGQNGTVFDVTEECDALSSAHIYRQFFKL